MVTEARNTGSRLPPDVEAQCLQLGLDVGPTADVAAAAEATSAADTFALSPALVAYQQGQTQAQEAARREDHIPPAGLEGKSARLAEFFEALIAEYVGGASRSEAPPGAHHPAPSP